MEILTKLGINQKIRASIMDYISPLSVVVLLIFFTSINKNFLSITNIRNLFTDMAPLLVIGCGITFVLIIGSIDLSLGSVCSCSAVILAVLLPKVGGLGYLASILFGIVAGLINGIVFTKMKIPSFIVTLGALSVWQSVAYLISKGAPVLIAPKEWNHIGWTRIQFGVFTMPFILSLLLLLVLFIIQKKTVFGKYSYAVGANERASWLAGVNNDATKIISFTICGTLSALTGILLATKLRSGIPTVGDPITLMGIAAAALGGTSLSGGKGSVVRAMLGAAIVIVIQNGMNLIAIDAFWQQIVFGFLVIAALYMTIDRSGRNIVMK